MRCVQCRGLRRGVLGRRVGPYSHRTCYQTSIPVRLLFFFDPSRHPPPHPFTPATSAVRLDRQPPPRPRDCTSRHPVPAPFTRQCHPHRTRLPSFVLPTRASKQAPRRIEFDGDLRKGTISRCVHTSLRSTPSPPSLLHFVHIHHHVHDACVTRADEIEFCEAFNIVGAIPPPHAAGAVGHGLCHVTGRAIACSSPYTQRRVLRRVI
ncbi:hypothetical protein C8F04DRAFT_504940 [Mycena alexandri]|uniref:Uncharacterized protein n=1 Tax=Mycena alexandri TaxID=1745969 RepID=A0AAD6T1V4_9AGAR|nr:hypothetical protein C8F04DRAFT_504940 [Mycena alexandri]